LYEWTCFVDHREAFLSIWRSRLRYDQARGSVRTWVLGVVHNRAIDALRRSVAHDRRRETMDGVEERFESRDRTDVEAARREEARSVRSALATLPEDQRRTRGQGAPRPARDRAARSSSPTSGGSATVR
jgi:RNA polymerase sigma factor (sigma-70 family)